MGRAWHGCRQPAGIRKHLGWQPARPDCHQPWRCELSVAAKKSSLLNHVGHGDTGRPPPLPPDCRCLELLGPSQKRSPHGRKAGLCIGPYAAHHPERWASMASAQATIRRADTGHMARASRHTTARRQRQCQDNERDEWWKWPFRLPPEAGTARIRRARPDSDCAGFAGYRPIPPARCRHAAQSVPWRYASPCPG